ncbi:MFS general substrate transporter [Stipitochalara longipes BDJ]|nr:MFS general substrate transporter [Stipitochalara longipes BDJ]
MPYVVRHSRNRLSLPKFELPPLQDPRDTRELALPSSTSYGGSYFSTTHAESGNLIDKPLDRGVEFPEGGRRAWLVNIFRLTNLKKTDAGTVGWIFSFYAFCTFGGGLFVGPLFDKYGPRWLVLAGSVLVVLSMDLIGSCIEFWQFVVCFSILGGVGSTLLLSPSIAIIGHYFSRRRGFATGIAATLDSLVLCSFANVFLQPLQVLGSTVNAWPDLLILRQPIFALTVLGVFLLEFALFVPLTYINSYSQSMGFSSLVSSAVLPVLNIGSVFGRCLPGYFADRYGRYNIAILAVVLTIVAVFDIWLPFGHTAPGLMVFALLFGLCSGSNISLTPVCIGQLCPVEQYGRYYSTCFSIVSIGCLTGVPLAGMILDADKGRYRGLILFVGGCYASGLVAFIWARLMATKWRLKSAY